MVAFSRLISFDKTNYLGCRMARPTPGRVPCSRHRLKPTVYYSMRAGVGHRSHHQPGMLVSPGGPPLRWGVPEKVAARANLTAGRLVTPWRVRRWESFLSPVRGLLFVCNRFPARLRPVLRVIAFLSAAMVCKPFSSYLSAKVPPWATAIADDAIVVEQYSIRT